MATIDSATAWEAIRKPKEFTTVKPNLVDYQRERARFDWKVIEDALERLPKGKGLNIAHEAVDRHAASHKANHLALRWLGKQGEVKDFSYADLKTETSRFANLLKGLGIAKGDRVFALLGRIPELYIAALGSLKNASVFCPLFSAFGPEPIKQRINIGDGKVLVTTPRLFKRKVAGILTELPTLEHILLIGDAAEVAEFKEAKDFHALMARADTEFEIPATDPEDMALLHFTSGTTGKPKGAIHVHKAVMQHYMTGKYALDMHEGDVFWCTADPGWVTGTSYGIIAPLLQGISSIIDEADFDADRWYGIIQDQQVNIWYTAPTAVRMLMKVGKSVAKTYDLSSLRFIASVGEPLNPEAVVWGNETFGMPIHDNWWQTETGGIMIANFRSMEVRPGSMGKPLPGIEASIVRRHEDGTVEEISQPNVEGELVLKPGWPSMFRGYLHEEERYKKAFKGGWYLSGDLARRDAEGYFWFIGRADDVIKSAGHLIGPFEVESALIEHPAVAEAGVIGIPDETAGELVKAFVTLNAGYEPNDNLLLELIAHGRKRLGPAVAPKQIAFRDKLPLTRSGKIMRRLLKARELGLPEGDISTLEVSE